MSADDAMNRIPKGVDFLSLKLLKEVKSTESISTVRKILNFNRQVMIRLKTIPITTLDITRIHGMISLTAEVLKENKNITTLIMRVGPTTSPNDFTILLESLYLRPMKTLIMSNSYLVSFSDFIRKIIANTLVGDLVLSNCMLTSTLSYISHGFTTSNVVSVDISQNQLTPEDVAALCSVLPRAKLKYLNISYCGLGQKQMELLLDSIPPISTMESLNAVGNIIKLTKSLLRKISVSSLLWINLLLAQIPTAAVYNFLMVMSMKLSIRQMHRPAPDKRRQIGNHRGELLAIMRAMRYNHTGISAMPIPMEIVYMIMEQYLIEKKIWYEYAASYYL